MVGASTSTRHRVASRHFLTAGVEYRDNVKQVLKNYDPEPYVLYVESRNQSIRWGAFAQDEIRLVQPLTLYAGVRLDRYEGFGSAPRAPALVWSTRQARRPRSNCSRDEPSAHPTNTSCIIEDQATSRASTGAHRDAGTGRATVHRGAACSSPRPHFGTGSMTC